jgi:hypothetical protein
MENILRDPIELTVPERDIVAGGFRYHLSFHFTLPMNSSNMAAAAPEEEVISGNGSNGNGNGNNGNGNGNGNGNTHIP